MALTAVPVDKQSPFIGEACALCKQPFGPGDEIVICPEDATRHHVHCWRSYGNRCTAYGCTGQGIVDSVTQEAEGSRSPQGSQANETKVQTLPARSFHCAQSCLLLSIAVAIILIAIGCFGLWAIADYIMIDVLDLPYREPLAGAALLLTDSSPLFP
jgi:hypothetical protein